MIITIKRDDNLFDPNVTDELNKAFYNINKNIEAYENRDLDYKEDVQYLGTNTNSFRSGNLICIRENILIDKRHDSHFDKVGNLLVSIPYDVWCYGITEKNEPMLVHIKNTDISVYGMLSTYPQTLYICQDIIVP